MAGLPAATLKRATIEVVQIETYWVNAFTQKGGQNVRIMERDNLDGKVIVATIEGIKLDWTEDSVYATYARDFMFRHGTGYWDVWYMPLLGNATSTLLIDHFTFVEPSNG